MKLSSLILLVLTVTQGFLGTSASLRGGDRYLQDLLIPMSYNESTTTHANDTTVANTSLSQERGLQGGSCGGGKRGNGICANGQCCSKWGWCGTSPAHCAGGGGGGGSGGGGGQGTCGGGKRGNGICANGKCCSQYGWCGTSPAHCTTTGGSGGSGGGGGGRGTCGGGKRGNGICSNGQCCSRYGWCGTSPAHCAAGSGGGSGGGGSGGGGGGGCPAGWTPARWTYYHSFAPCCRSNPNYNPTADTTECVSYNACAYPGIFAYIGRKSFDYVKTNNIVSFFTTRGNNRSYGNKNIRVSSNGRTIEALVADTCGDHDCNGCCTRNAGSTGNVVDMEYYTVLNNFGDPRRVAHGTICWQLVS